MEENKMGVMPVNKLLISMALPMMISMLVQALYNIVDSMFVAQISENALTAVSLAFPAQNLMIAIGTGTGVGINALVSRSLGERNQERANLIANNGLALYVISGILFAIFGLLGSNLFFRAQTDDPEIVRLGTEYLRICCLLSTAIFLQFGFERILQATGRTFYTMLTQGLGAIVNIIMDPILIFGLFGAPKLGVRGAAIATVFGQICADGILSALPARFWRGDRGADRDCGTDGVKAFKSETAFLTWLDRGINRRDISRTLSNKNGCFKRSTRFLFTSFSEGHIL